ncbi:MAG: DUF1059 domain-containing protein [Acidobacteria bacterium]|nr:DUF1059 domain-containing protein [Acidobacteriota bacterium]
MATRSTPDVLQQAGIHAKEHGLEPTPELIEKVRASIEDEQAAAQA